MICHLFSNLTMATVLPLIAEADRGRYRLTFTVIEVAVGLGLLLATRGRWAGGPPRGPGRVSATRSAGRPGSRPW